MGGMEEGQRPGPAGRYGVLLATLIAAYLVSAVTASRWGGGIHLGFIAAIGGLSLRNARRLSPRAARLARAVIVVTAIAAVLGVTSDNTAAQGAGDIWGAVILLLTVLIIVDRVLRVERVTAQSLYAAVSAYLLIGMMFSEFFSALDVLVAGPFFANGQPANNQTLQYFSFATLTTLGYGDFTAVGSLGRAVAVLEALSGQVFLATLVARLVSAYDRGSGGRPRPGK
jgi:hypothetical protein